MDSKLLELDLQRQEYVGRGEYLKAQAAVDAMREHTINKGKRLEKKVSAVASDPHRHDALIEKHRQQLMQFTQLWEQRLQQYDEDAEKIISDVKRRHNREFKEQEGIIRADLASKRPHFSKRVLRTRAALERLVGMKYYREANDMQKVLDPLEKEETRKFDEHLSIAFSGRTKLLKQQYQTEMVALKQKIASGRDELVAQRKADFELLTQRHHNALKEAKQIARTETSKRKTILQKHLNALVMDPGRAAASVVPQPPKQPLVPSAPSSARKPASAQGRPRPAAATSRRASPRS